jgi:hypothetical protein
MVFTENQAKILHTWPSLEAVRNRTKKTGWQPFTPRFRLLRPKNLAKTVGFPEF